MTPKESSRSSGGSARNVPRYIPMTSRDFTFEQTLVILCCLFVRTGHHCRNGDNRQLEDIIRREKNSWKLSVTSMEQVWSPQNAEEYGLDAWDSFASALTSACPGLTITIPEIQAQLDHINEQLKRLGELSYADCLTRLPSNTSNKFDWERNVQLICCHHAVTTLNPQLSKIFEHKDLESLTHTLATSSMFPEHVAVDQLKSMIEKLCLLFKGSTTSRSIPRPGEGGRLEVGDRGLTGTKRPSQEELCTGKRVKVTQPDSNDVVDL